MGKTAKYWVALFTACILTGCFWKRIGGEIIHERVGPEANRLRNIAMASRMYFADNPGKEISGLDALEKNYLGPDPFLFHPEYDWLPMSQMYAFVKSGSGDVPGSDGGPVLAVCTLSLTKRELGERANSPAERNQPGRFVLWKVESEYVCQRWFPENELNSFMKAGVLDAITLPKPKTPPRRIAGTVLWPWILGALVVFCTLMLIWGKNLKTRQDT